MGRSKSNHKARFLKWQRHCPEKTRVLSTLVVSELVPLLEAHGFCHVAHSLRQPDQLVSGRELELERWGAESVDTVTFNFDKYGAPRFQVHLSRRLSDPPHAWVRSANLVRRPSQYLCFWGKPWCIPEGLWPEGASRRVVGRIKHALPDALALLDHGERGTHISRRVA